MHVNNGSQGRLVIDGVHDGEAGIQEPTTGEWARFKCHRVVAFRANAATRKAAAGDRALLDGAAFTVVAVEPSRVSAGFERAYLARVDA